MMKERLSFLIQSSADLQTFNHFSSVVSKFALIRSDKVGTLNKIVLERDFFTNLETNYLPIKVFKDLYLEGGIGFDVQGLLSDNRFVWVAAMLIELRHLTSLSQLMELRRQLLLFVEIEVVPALVNLAQKNADFIVALFDHLVNEGKVHTIEYLA